MFNFLMLFSLLRNIMSLPHMYYCCFLNNNQSCHGNTSKEVHVQELLSRGLLHLGACPGYPRPSDWTEREVPERRNSL